ncbi:calcium/calmodulin-dependent protein kinase kinase 2/serine/threonine-protein kinase ssp1 [Golovinomyces cichoracearum]|uniref:non-specific serine/threonine protein kinase n=1 Tax=Golovinomyces cichoracearum TaxID=62708 RepID=A0A420I5V3_9PEZI|nr:calcium/calmodulin-dependent protein kinase kinase 2/serine/threonine-protein kinase ssp1 [Golovinomyces cichoracearum]
MDALRTSFSTPASSPGLYNPGTTPDLPHISSRSYSDDTPQSSPYLHPLQMHRVRETSKAQVEQDFITGRKLINQYEIINEIGRGMHGKVKLGRSLQTGEYVAIKIIQRFSKKRKLGRVTFSPEGKTKREIAILKKVRHTNVVGLLEVIDDPELKKIYMILEHVELGEIVWRRKGTPQICLYERRRIENQQTGEKDNSDDEKYFRKMDRRRARRTAKRAQNSQLNFLSNPNHWSLEHGQDEDDELSTVSKENTDGPILSIESKTIPNIGSQNSNRASSNSVSASISQAHIPLPVEPDIPPIDSDNESLEDNRLLPFMTLSSRHGSSSGLDELIYSSCPDNQSYRDRSPSIADSIISHISSIDDIPHDTFQEDFSYVPCFTLDQARSAFRDTVLGLEYLHYEGIVHRDIKPANLLWTKDHRVKISDFGVSYFGRPTRDDETEENISEADATDFDDDLELAKTVGTPAFFAPELCCTDLGSEQPKITEQIDVWSLGITLYCLIFARIPFLAKDEWQLFRCIAKDDVYIPRRRLKAVRNNTSVSPTGANQNCTSSGSSYREENELAYDFVDDELYDLLKRMLVKDPSQRIKLKEVKCHPWLLRGLEDIISWLDETDPSRVTAGRRIEVDNHELERAVVPITFLERARTAVKKAVGKVIGATKGDIRNDRSRKGRRRAQSSAASSGTDSNQPTPVTPTISSSRRYSIRGDEAYFGFSANGVENNLETNDNHSSMQNSMSSQSLSSDLSEASLSRSRGLSPGVFQDTNHMSLHSSDTTLRKGIPERIFTILTPKRAKLQRGHAYSRSVNSPGTPKLKTMNSNLSKAWDCVRPRDSLPDIKESSISRVHSVDRNLFKSGDIYTEAEINVSVMHPSEKLQQPPTYSNESHTQETCQCLLKERSLIPSENFEQESHSDHNSNSTLTRIHSHTAIHSLDDESTDDKEYEKSSIKSQSLDTNMVQLLSSSLECPNRNLTSINTDTKLDCPVFANSIHCADSFHDTSPKMDVVPQHTNGFNSQIAHDDSLIDEVANKYSNLSEFLTADSISSPLISPNSSVSLCLREKSFSFITSLPILLLGASTATDDDASVMHKNTDIYACSFGEMSASMIIPSPILRRDLSIDLNNSIVQEVVTLGCEDEEGYNGDGDTTSEWPDRNSDSDDDLPTMKCRARVIPKTTRARKFLRRKSTSINITSSEVGNQKITI